MTVNDLIKLLSNLPGDMRVVIHGHEGGYNDAETVEQRPIVVGTGGDDWWGRHDDPWEGRPSDEIACLID